MPEILLGKPPSVVENKSLAVKLTGERPSKVKPMVPAPRDAKLLADSTNRIAFHRPEAAGPPVKLTLVPLAIVNGPLGKVAFEGGP
jgi:hypothetical protein